MLAKDAAAINGTKVRLHISSRSDHHERRFSVAHPFAFVSGPPPPPQSFAISLLGRGLLGYKLTYSLGIHLEEKVRVSRNLGIGA